MEKMFVNALAYSKILKWVMVIALIFILMIDMLFISLVVKVIDSATPEERTKIIWLAVLLILSSAAGFPIFYFVRRSLREQWIGIGEQGIRYNSPGKKIAASWDQVVSVSIVSRGRFGQALRTKGLRIDTKNGQIYALPIFVDKSAPIPQLKMGISSQKLLYPDGRTREMNAETSDVYMELQNHIPELFNART